MAADKTEFKILVIEDNPGDFTLVEDFLFEQIAAPQIKHAITFGSAREILTTTAFDAILLDLSLPDKTGEQLIHEILEICKNTPVIVLTGFADFSFGVKSLSMGIADYILKDDLTSMSLYKSIVYSIKRQKSTLELAKSEKRYSDLFSLSPLPTWVFDPETLQFLDVNDAAVKHYGFSRGELLSMTLNDIRPADEVPTLLQYITENRERQFIESPRLAVHKKKNGEIINVQLDIAQIEYNGRPANLVAVTDITERLKYVNAIEEQNKRLKAISWIQSHIVRAPLARLMGLIQVLDVCADDKEETEKILQFISASAVELDETVRAITDKSKIDEFSDLEKPGI
jgi:PAS domain S-box-containing protein